MVFQQKHNKKRVSPIEWGRTREKRGSTHKAKHGLIIKAKISFGLQNKKGRAQKRMGENHREEKRKREKKKEKEEKNKKKRREEEKKSKKVWNYEFLYEFPCNCMVSSLSQT